MVNSVSDKLDWKAVAFGQKKETGHISLSVVMVSCRWEKCGVLGNTDKGRRWGGG